MSVQGLLIVLALALLLETLRSHVQLRRAIFRRPEPAKPPEYPSVTVIRPIKGLDAGAEENVRAALDTGYPGEVETLFVFDSVDEPAHPIVVRAIAERGGERDANARIIIANEPPPGRTGKLNAMIAGLNEARGTLIAFADSDIRPDRDALRVLVETLLSRPAAGSAFAPVVVSEKPETLGDAGYAILLNGMYGPAASQAARKGGWELPFIMGQFMVFHRSVIADICGLESAEGQLVDDMYLGARVRAAGYRNLVSPHAVPIIQKGLPFREFWRTYVRWITFSKSGLPGREFKLLSYIRPTAYWVGLLAAAVALANGWYAAGLLAALVPVSISVSINNLHHVLGGGRLSGLRRIASFAVLLISPVVLASISTKSEVNWRGRTYKLSPDSKLAAGAHRPVGEVCRDPDRDSPGWYGTHG